MDYHLLLKSMIEINNNASIIEVSRKVAQLLRFYKSKIARVRVEIMSQIPVNN